MKKLILTPFIFALITCIYSCKFEQVVGNGNTTTKSITVGEFDKIKSSGSFDVSLVKGTEGDIEISNIEENLLEYLNIEVINSTLKLKWKNGTSIKSNSDISIIIPFKDIDEVSLLGSGEIKCTDTIVTQKLETTLSGSGIINLVTKTSEIKSKITGSGDIILAGKVYNLETKITGSGNFIGDLLNAQKAEAKITGSGNILLMASDAIDAKITGSGDIKHKGNTKSVNKKVTGSGDVINVN